jgi:uncharacterized membrane protein YgdD (TMEM256/DUF423 family)
MTRLWIAIAGLGGFLSVAAGALAAHLAGGQSKAAPLLRTAAHYGLAHAASLIAVAALAERRQRTSSALAAAGWSFSGGILLFSGSLLALAMTGIRAVAFMTPLGGAAMLFGWAALAFAAFDRGRPGRQ